MSTNKKKSVESFRAAKREINKKDEKRYEEKKAKKIKKEITKVQEKYNINTLPKHMSILVKAANIFPLLIDGSMLDER